MPGRLASQSWGEFGIALALVGEMICHELHELDECSGGCGDAC